MGCFVLVEPQSVCPLSGHPSLGVAGHQLLQVWKLNFIIVPGSSDLRMQIYKKDVSLLMYSVSSSGCPSPWVKLLSSPNW